MNLNSLKLLSVIIFAPVFVCNAPVAHAGNGNGCGDGKTAFLLSAASPIASRQFKVACNEHDTCYDTLGKSKSDCDKAFHNRMLGICARDHNTFFGRPLKIACNGRADAYYNSVRKFGGTAYDNAQNAARK
jgi:Group XII secretory phospholipase A2 precursor (PLA2G12)